MLLLGVRILSFDRHIHGLGRKRPEKGGAELDFNQKSEKVDLI